MTESAKQAVADLTTKVADTLGLGDKKDSQSQNQQSGRGGAAGETELTGGESLPPLPAGMKDRN